MIPGNHDSRNVGYVHFEKLFGERNSVLRKDGVTIVAVDSTEPDLDNGQIGRGRYRWIEEQFAEPADLRIFVLHHHLLPVPGTGRERNIVHDAGDTLEALQRAGVDLVLCRAQARPVRVASRGPVRRQRRHRLVVAAPRQGRGPVTTSSRSTGSHVDVWRRYPFHGQERIIQFSPDDARPTRSTRRASRTR